VDISRKVRLRAVWLLIVPFFWFARPSPLLLAVGIGLAALGLSIRASAAGFIHKDRELTTTGPYAFTRNPLYLGSFFLGIGITLGGGNPIFVALFVVFFAAVYTRTIRHETRQLQAAFGDEYAEYARHVPVFVPRLTPYRRPASAPSSGFSSQRWKRNREYEALLGAVAAFGLLMLRMWMR
jgi:protein-S-isoprenylcysteine O-methyltransferase Ste14